MAGRPPKNKTENVNEEIVQENTIEIEDEVVETATSYDTVENLNYEEKVTIRSIAPWNTGFVKSETNGEINLAPNGTARISRAEAIAQFEKGNKLICGDGTGNHATIYIEDEKTRKYLGIQQTVISDKFIRSLFAIEGVADFEKAISETFYTRAEKSMLINNIRKYKYNEYNKVRFCEIHCGMTV